MYTKTCSRCLRPSYSSCDYGQWLCPYCLNDISEAKARHVNYQVDLVSLQQKLNWTRAKKAYK
jgi:hypothetical protein